MMTQDELKELLHYDKDTGVFTWKVSRGRASAGSIAGNIGDQGYVIIRINSKGLKAHRLAWLYINGYFPEQEIDHINRVRCDNSICNLREVSRTCNVRNSGISKNNTSGIVGVYYQRKKWESRIVVDRKIIYLGAFDSFNDAVQARWEAEKKYDFPNCNTTSTAYQYLTTT